MAYLDGILLPAELFVVLQVERRAVQLARDGCDGLPQFIDPRHEIRPAHGDVQLLLLSLPARLEIDKLPLEFLPAICQRADELLVSQQLLFL